MSNRRNNNKVTKNLKDYAVPLIWLVIILIIVFNIFSWGSSETKTIESIVQNENTSWLSLSFDASLDADIINNWWNTKVSESNKNLSKWDKLRVNSWNLLIDFPSVWKLNLDKNWELEYTKNWEISLDSSYLWINTIKSLNVKMKYANVSIWENSTVSLDQNEVGSTVYLLNWTVNVSNLVWKNIVLEKWEKITIQEKMSSSQDVDLSFEKWLTKDYFEWTEWYSKNNGDLYMNVSWSLDLNLTSTWELTWSWEENTKINNSSDELIVVDNPTWDEAFSETSTIDIEWTILDENIAEITINWIKTKINKETNKFSLKNFWLDKKTNDLVYKVFNENKDVLWKYVKTIYYQWWQDDSVSTTWFNVENFSVDALEFKFTRPSSEWIYTTYEDTVSIYWETPKGIIKKVRVNWYQLKSFNWSSWRYHASIANNNLKEWSNVYEIKYYWEWDKLVYKNTFTIIKKIQEKKI